MAKNRKTPRGRWDAVDEPAVLELPPGRAFVLHLDARAQPPRRVVGRVEHVTSGRVAHIASLRGLLAFLVDVLRDEARSPHSSTAKE